MMELVPGKLYRTKASVDLFYKMHNGTVSDLFIIPLKQVLLFVREEYTMKNGYYVVVIYFLYGRRIVYDHRYNTEQIFCYLEELI